MTGCVVEFDGDDEDDTSSSLIRYAQCRDSEAWSRLIAIYAPRVYRQCRRCGVQPCSAQDIVQEVFMAVLRKLPEFQHGEFGSNFRGWLYRITRNKILDHLKSEGRLPLAEGGSEAQLRFLRLVQHFSDSLSHVGSPSEKLLALQQAMLDVQALVGEKSWNLFAAVVLDDLLVAEVAEKFAVTHNVVYLAKSRTLRLLRENLAMG